MSMVMAIQTSNPLALVEEPRLHALQNSQSCSVSIPSTDDRRAGTGKQRCDNCARNAPTRMQNFGGPLARFINPGYRRKDGDMEKLVDPSESKRTSLVS